MIRRSQPSKDVRHLIVVLGDQLNADSAAFDGFDPACDVVLQIEAKQEACYVPQHKMRLVFFFSAMRHLHHELKTRGYRAHYVALDDPENTGHLDSEIARHQAVLKPKGTVVLEPGDWRVREMLRRMKQPPEFRSDRHFLCSTTEFGEFTTQHPRPILETFYRFMRRKTGLLMDQHDHPVGGSWNFDADNRKSFSKTHPPPVPPARGIAPDAITREVIALVTKQCADSPGRLVGFDLPVTPADARTMLRDFVDWRLPLFGTYQDAMLSDEPYLYHSRLSGPLNLHMLDPREILDAALTNKSVPLNALEGFVRQILGWREFVRGVYWQRMPHYADENALDAALPMPRFYWTGETEMRCLAQAIGHTIDHAYAHHIERLMVLGLFAMLLGVKPYDVHLWHMSMFHDAIDWVSLPNTLGMSQYGDGGIMGTKPYAASGQYIDRMSDHCRHCRYNPKQATGADACPFTTLYWNFLAKHRKRFAGNARMRNHYSNLDRRSAAEIRAIRSQADQIIAAMG